jgi:hypothetical protein
VVVVVVVVVVAVVAIVVVAVVTAIPLKKSKLSLGGEKRKIHNIM